MNLSRRRFLKSLLATSALAPIAPALVEAAAPSMMDRWAAVMDKLTADAMVSGRGYWSVVIYPGWNDVIAEWKREAEFYRAEQWPEAPLFDGSIGHIDGWRFLEPEDEPIGPAHDQLVLMEDGLSLWPTRRMTREQLMTEGFSLPQGDDPATPGVQNVSRGREPAWLRSAARPTRRLDRAS